MKTCKNIKRKNPKAQVSYSSTFRRKGTAAAYDMNVKVSQASTILKEVLMLLGMDFIENNNILRGAICENDLYINQEEAKRLAPMSKYVEYW